MRRGLQPWSATAADIRFLAASSQKLRRIDDVRCKKPPLSVDRNGPSSHAGLRRRPHRRPIAGPFGAEIESYCVAARSHDRECPGECLPHWGINRRFPDGFEAAYTRETSASDDPAKFATKAQYLAWLDQVKAASLAAVEATAESDWMRRAPSHARPCPDGRLGAAVAGHPLADACGPVRADPAEARQAAHVLSWQGGK